MKYIILLASGLADEPCDELDGLTPLAAARTPALDALAEKGKLAGVTTLPEDLPLSEEVALFSCLGYDPHTHFAGEGGLAAAGIGLDPDERQTAFLHRLVTEADDRILDHTAGYIKPAEAEALLVSLRNALPGLNVTFHTCRGFAGITIIDAIPEPPPPCQPPEALWSESWQKALPADQPGEAIRTIIEKSREVFAEHEINRVRADLGENPANLLWLWGPGRATGVPSFQERHSLQGCLIGASESARGLARLAGMETPDVLGATGTPESDLAAKARRAIDELALCDVVFVHVAAPAEASLCGNEQAKVATIHRMDSDLVMPLMNYASENEFVRLCVLPTHAASVTQRTRLRTPVPAVLFGSGMEALRGSAFREDALDQAEIVVERGHELLEYFLRT